MITEATWEAQLRLERKRSALKIRSLEVELFPEFRDWYLSGDNKWFHFSPSYHFRSGLITMEDIKAIKQGKKHVLTVGSGPAHLERLLVQELGVLRSQITLSDITETMPSGFRKITFDMYSEWPSFDRKFDYVLFPQSVYQNLGISRDREGLIHLARNSLKVTTDDAHIHMTGWHENSNMYSTDVAQQLIQTLRPHMLEVDIAEHLILLRRKTRYKS